MSELVDFERPVPEDGAPTRARQDVGLALMIWAASSLVALLGAAFGFDFLQLAYGDVTASHATLLDRLTARDGKYYERIAENGYSYTPGQQSNVAFFPAYPLLARVVAAVGRTSIPIAMLIVSNACFLLACVVLVRYARRRSYDPGRMLLLVAFVPAGLFFHVGYSESLFLLLAVLVLHGLNRRWPLEAVALIAGAATATRAPGVALAAPVIVEALRRHVGTPRSFWRAAVVCALSGWGLLAFMTYQHVAFGDALAFARTQQQYFLRSPDPTQSKLAAYALFEPIWSVYAPGSPAHWRRFGAQNPLFSLAFQNPLYFVAAMALAAVGTRQRWLNRSELVYCWLGLLIPYFTRGFDMCMGSQARFSIVVFPLYFVVSRLLARVGPIGLALIVAICAFLLGAFMGMFGAGYTFV